MSTLKAAVVKRSFIAVAAFHLEADLFASRPSLTHYLSGPLALPAFAILSWTRLTISVLLPTTATTFDTTLLVGATRPNLPLLTIRFLI
jgi:hypothetical protein